MHANNNIYLHYFYGNTKTLSHFRLVLISLNDCCLLNLKAFWAINFCSCWVHFCYLFVAPSFSLLPFMLTGWWNTNKSWAQTLVCKNCMSVKLSHVTQVMTGLKNKLSYLKLQGDDFISPHIWCAERFCAPAPQTSWVRRCIFSLPVLISTQYKKHCRLKSCMPKTWESSDVLSWCSHLYLCGTSTGNQAQTFH